MKQATIHSNQRNQALPQKEGPAHHTQHKGMPPMHVLSAPPMQPTRRTSPRASNRCCIRAPLNNGRA